MAGNKGFFGNLFGFKKDETCSCSCNNEEKKQSSGNENLIILGSGCKNCMALEKEAIQAVNELGTGLTVGHITDFSKIAEYGVMSMPGLVFNGKVISSGKVLKKEEIIELINKNI